MRIIWRYSNIFKELCNLGFEPTPLRIENKLVLFRRASPRYCNLASRLWLTTPSFRGFLGQILSIPTLKGSNYPKLPLFPHTAHIKITRQIISTRKKKHVNKFPFAIYHNLPEISILIFFSFLVLLFLFHYFCYSQQT